ncbi:MAG: 2OG-Fe(II) oxygenase [Gammaproteobacteria bacterium]|nr:2OG-Fe(II) oxygenase [Gammaproteobacteria bacterium]
MMDPELPVIWQNLIIQLQSKAYIDALEHACGLQLSDAYQEITLKRYGHNHYISSHTDKEEVRATHMIFLNEHWEKEWGGELCFLNSNQEITNQFTPTYQQSVFFIRSENSWHSVNKIIHHNEERIAIQVAFWNTTQRTVLPGRQTVYI